MYYLLDSLKEPQTAMYTLASDLTWTTLEHNLPLAMTAHCSVQISQDPPKVAFIGGVPTADNLWSDVKLDQIKIFNMSASGDEIWTDGPTLPSTVVRGGLIGCYKVPNENKVIFGCSFASGQKAYEWNLDDDSITELFDCLNRGAKFYVLADGTVIASGHNRNIFNFDPTNGFTRTSPFRIAQYSVPHSPPMSLVNPAILDVCQ